MLRCEKCKHEAVSEKKYPCSKCDSVANDLFEPKKQTNADQIRSMSDEELAEFLGQYFTCEYECPAAKDGCSRDCNGTIMEWLQSEVEGQHEQRRIG